MNVGMEELNIYFDNISPEQFKKDWEKAVGSLPKSVGPNVQDLLNDWEEFYGCWVEPEPINKKVYISNIEAPEFIQGLSF